MLNDIGQLPWKPSGRREAIEKLVELGYAEFGKEIGISMLAEAEEDDIVRKALEHHAKAGRG